MIAKLIVAVIVMAKLFCCAMAAVWLNMQESILPDDEDD